MSTQTITRGAVAWLLLAAWSAASLAGCATAPAAKAPEDDPETVDEASAALDQAERDLQALVLGGDRADSADQAQGAQPAAPATGQSSELAKSRSERRATDRCVTACRALSSMNRAARRLCSLAGGEDARCQGAETRVAAARKLVREACPSCSA